MIDNKTNPLVSVIIPTYNRAYLIKRSIKSVLNQTYQNFEIIIVDDGSIDNTKEIIESFNENRIKYIKHKQNKGAAAARNTGIKCSKADFIAFQDSDDEWLPEKLEKEIGAFGNSTVNVGVVYSGLWYIKNNEKRYVPHLQITKKEGNVHNELLAGNFVSGLTVIRKTCFEKVGLFNESLQSLEDWELYIRISKHFCFKFIDEPLSLAYCSSDSASINYYNLTKSSELILEEHFEDFDKNNETLAVNYATIGLYAFLGREEKKSRKYLRKAIIANPFKLRYLTAFILSFFGKKSYNIFLKSLES
ncbi:glycosyltransferase family 2 protein [Methanobacterium sp.]|uniref:glycosyltransferase family 2 protein n=1 Tax=Methanobacterium sp. TaxID=2164 RepID=UPI0031590B9D